MNFHYICSDCGSDNVERCGAVGYVYCEDCDAITTAEIEEDEE